MYRSLTHNFPQKDTMKLSPGISFSSSSFAIVRKHTFLDVSWWQCYLQLEELLEVSVWDSLGSHYVYMCLMCGESSDTQKPSVDRRKMAYEKSRSEGMPQQRETCWTPQMHKHSLFTLGYLQEHCVPDGRTCPRANLYHKAPRWS